MVDIEPLVPSVRELQSYGIAFDSLIPFYTATGGSAVCNGPNSNGGTFAASGASTLNQVYFAIEPIH